jgi:D-beta-D-heptose 7-phosphate kinase/D-beta-D-heptose 1-phosphate adenosyltransferase
MGMLLLEPGAEPLHVPTRAREVFDVSGAGDTVIAVATLALAAGAGGAEAAEIANFAAGVVVGKIGTAICAPDELLAFMQGNGVRPRE